MSFGMSLSSIIKNLNKIQHVCTRPSTRSDLSPFNWKKMEMLKLLRDVNVCDQWNFSNSLGSPGEEWKQQDYLGLSRELNQVDRVDFSVVVFFFSLLPVRYPWEIFTLISNCLLSFRKLSEWKFYVTPTHLRLNNSHLKSTTHVDPRKRYFTYCNLRLRNWIRQNGVWRRWKLWTFT